METAPGPRIAGDDGVCWACAECTSPSTAWSGRSASWVIYSLAVDLGRESRVEEEQYRREGWTTLPPSLLERGSRDHVDAVIAVAMCVALDALGFDDISVDVHRSGGVRRWRFERELATSTTVEELLDGA